MELHKQTIPDLKFKWKDVTFSVRPKATARDKHVLVTMGDVGKDGIVKVPKATFYPTLIELFVTGWTGVTMDGKEVPFSLEHLYALPADPKEDVILVLGSFVLNNTGLVETVDEERKKKA